MIHGFESIFGDAKQVHIVVSEEGRPTGRKLELAQAPNSVHALLFVIQNTTDFKSGEAVYRFFELFDLANVPNAETILNLAKQFENSC